MDSSVCPFSSLQFFVACLSLLQLTQLMISSLMKASISSIEKRFGFSHQTSGLVGSFNEVGNTLLIIFVSYFGSRVHRPRVIGCGAMLVSVAAFIIALPQFVLGIYEFDRSVPEKSNLTDVCLPDQKTRSKPQQCTVLGADESQLALFLLLLGQGLLGIGTVPIQSFGISYIDDFASRRNSPVYVGIIYAATAIGPTIAFPMMSFMLQIYVDASKVSIVEIQLTTKDPRWVGAWWLGFLFASALAAISAIPYFFFPRELPKEKEDPLKVIQELCERDLVDEPRVKLEDLTLRNFIKMFPKVLTRNFKNPFLIMAMLTIINYVAMVIILANFLAKFLEAQFTLVASDAIIIAGSSFLPMVTLGILLGGVIIKKFQLTLQQSSLLCIGSMSLCLFFSFPLLFLGCSTHPVAGLDSSRSGGPMIFVFDCNRRCSCSSSAFNPVCGQNKIEYISPCYAGCSDLQYEEGTRVVSNYTKCSCIVVKAALGSAVPGNCSRDCSTHLMPFLLFCCLAGFLASLAFTPTFMCILRNVKAEDKSFAIGIQYLFLRLWAFVPTPVLYGIIVNATCLLWERKCQRKIACRYYDNTAFRYSFIGIQLGYQVCSFLCLVVIYYLYQKENKSQEEPMEEIYLDEVPEQRPEAPQAQEETETREATG
ncbi:solute carrier organic anion transporter family member 2B1-like [Heteronotia binoei]|uniref:solute carrier organic anion transporter family member 2B1-like n=1 Tax=Heteronotia binoei TaxID=13085 RepID=UPI0029312820|nr:solute carrier organic anion transporter family member 2B1-like [Heteronotia binoei]